VPGSKNKGGGRKKGGSVKKPFKRKSAQVPKKIERPVGKGRGPVYAIAALVALIAIIVMANNHGSLKKYFDRIRIRTADTGDVPRQSKTAYKKGEQAVESKQEKKPEIQVKSSQLTVQAKIYFLTLNDRTEKVTLLPVTRTVAADEPLSSALKEMLRGPSAGEKRKGVLSAMPDGLVMRGVSIRNGIATIDFNSSFEENAIGNILMNRIDQIVYTATQFNEVKGVIITINGRRKTSIGPDGIVLSAPLTRQRH
jgi:spore germination protein GerM